MIQKYAQQNEVIGSGEAMDVQDLNVSEFLLPLMKGDTGGFAPLDVSEDLEVSEDDKPEQMDFALDEIPGAPGAKEIVVSVEPEQQDVQIEGEEGGSEWSPKTFLNWLHKQFNSVPEHSGYDTTGLEKAISHFERLDREITKAMRSDFKNEIDSAKAERAREQIENGLERLIERLETVKVDKYKRHAKKKSKSWAENVGMITKEAGTTLISGITITVPLLISRVARVCINGMVSGGHDLEDMFKRQVDEYTLTKREQAEVSQLLSDMGYPIFQDRGFAPGTPVDIWRSDNFDFGAQYRG